MNQEKISELAYEAKLALIATFEEIEKQAIEFDSMLDPILTKEQRDQKWSDWFHNIPVVVDMLQGQAADHWVYFQLGAILERVHWRGIPRDN